MTDGQWRHLSYLATAWAALLTFIAVIATSIWIEPFFDDHATKDTVGIIIICLSIIAPYVAARIVYNKMTRKGIERRKREDRCTACGYDLWGSTGGECPECGEAKEPDETNVGS